MGRPDKVDPALKTPKKKAVEGAPADGAAAAMGGASDGVTESKDASTEDDTAAADAQPREYYQYELAGIVIHTGTAQFG